MISATELEAARLAVQSASLEQLQVLQADVDDRHQQIQPKQILLRASTRVFSTTELLEHVLLYLDADDLFAVQRVDRNFHNTIDGSSKLQCKMLLKQTDKETFSDDWYSLISMSNSRLPEHNLLIAHGLEALGFVQVDADYESVEATHTSETPIDTPFLELVYTSEIQAVRQLLGTDNCWRNADGSRREFSDVQLGRPGSWMRMRLTAFPMWVKVRFTTGAEQLEGERAALDLWLEPDHATMGGSV